MLRRPVSPLRATKSQSDPRDAMIRKLKQELIVSRGRQKQLAILQNYLFQLAEKMKMLSADTAKTDEQGKIKLQLTHKTINQAKKEVQNMKIQLRNTNTELGEVEQQQSQWKKLLNTKTIQIQKLKKQSNYLHDENDKLIGFQYKLRNQEDQINHEIKKIGSTILDYQSRISQINRKIVEVKSFINQMSEENHTLKEKLKSYENQNTGMGNDLQQKQNKIDNLEKKFSEKHDQIKNQVENFIEKEHFNEKNLQQIRQKQNLTKIQNQKHNQLGNIIRKLQKVVSEKDKQADQIRQQSDELNKLNQDYITQNQKLKKDLAYCQQHLQNLLKHNVLIQQEMENFVREDEAIIGIIRRKKILPSLDNFKSLRTSRNEYKNSARNYI